MPFKVDIKESNLFETDDDKKMLKTMLKQHVVVVTFTKKDGSERIMNCTLQEDLIPIKVVSESANTSNVTIRTVNDDVVPVYDIDAKGWRSFRWDSVKSVQW